MSFKREGNDKNLLGILRQRRIKDLLAVDIPEDEAFLTSNGRLACIVCHHRPVFDTIEMLLVHRQGKKHAAGIAYQKQEKREIQQLILKRKHEKFIKDGTVNKELELQLSDSKKLCLGQAYDSRCKKNKNPKVKVNLNSKEIPSATSVGELPGNRVGCYTNKVCEDSALQQSDEICCKTTSDHQNSPKESTYMAMLEKQRDGPVLHSNQLKKVFEKPLDGPIRVTPYQSKNKRIKTTEHKVSTEFSTAKTLDFPHTKINGFDHKNVVLESHTLKSRLSAVIPLASKGKQEITSSSLSGKVKPQTPDKSNNRNRKIDQAENPNDGLKIAKAEKYLHYRGAGWKKDLFGNWVKDEDAEFDSDEEPPDLP